MTEPLTLTVPAEVLGELAELVERRVMARMAELGSDGWLGVDAAAEYLACSRKRIYDLKAMGRLQYAKDGARLLFKRSWLDAALDLHQDA